MKFQKIKSNNKVCTSRNYNNVYTKCVIVIRNELFMKSVNATV